MKYFSALFLATLTVAAPLPQAATAPTTPTPGTLQPGAIVPTSSSSQIGDGSTQIITAPGANPISAIRNFLGDVQLVSNAINLIGSGQVTDPATMALLCTVAFNAEIDEAKQASVMSAAAGPAGQNAVNNIVTFTPTVLNSLQACANNPNAQINQQNMILTGTVRDNTILPSIGNLGTAALAGAYPLLPVIQATIQQSTVQNGNPQIPNAAATLAGTLVTSQGAGAGQQIQQIQPQQQIQQAVPQQQIQQVQQATPQQIQQVPTGGVTQAAQQVAAQCAGGSC
ncbi:hypothetical protein HDV03_004483 [Kappamyces sp. JEL0829]|nr:hypothetical protein HDV03_004483 [Kappamyces sp. JEL0829]